MRFNLNKPEPVVQPPTTVTITLTEREFELLAATVGNLSPKSTIGSGVENGYPTLLDKVNSSLFRKASRSTQLTDHSELYKVYDEIWNCWDDNKLG
jgi:hypothetical protein